MYAVHTFERCFDRLGKGDVLMIADSVLQSLRVKD